MEWPVSWEDVKKELESLQPVIVDLEAIGVNFDNLNTLYNSNISAVTTAIEAAKRKNALVRYNFVKDGQSLPVVSQCIHYTVEENDIVSAAMLVFGRAGDLYVLMVDINNGEAHAALHNQGYWQV